MPAFAFLSFTCQLGQEGEGACLVKPAFRLTQHTRRLACLFGDGGHKLDYVAACIGKSRAYVSRLQSGKRSIPDKLIAPLCAATGSNLLRQYIDLQRAIEGVGEVERLAAMLSEAA